MAEIHGPTLEELDNWSGSIDALPYSLDSSTWLTADLWEASASAATAITATGSIGVQRHAVGTTAATAITATATALKIFDVDGSAAIAITVPAFDTVLEFGLIGVSASTAITVAATCNATFLVSGTAAAVGAEVSAAFVTAAGAGAFTVALTVTGACVRLVSASGTAEIAVSLTGAGLATLVGAGSFPLAITGVVTVERFLHFTGTAEAALPTVTLVAEELGETWSVVSAGGETWSLAA